MTTRSYYEILGVRPDATSDEIKSAYRRLARVFHPDRFHPTSKPKEWKNAHEMLLQLNEAYQVLKDHAARQRYDSMRNSSGQQERGTARDGTRNERNTTAEDRNAST